MAKHYKLHELEQMSIIELTTIADQSSIIIQNSIKQGLIASIIGRQIDLRTEKRTKSELHSRDRYAVANNG